MEDKSNIRSVNISSSTILKVVSLLLVLGFLYAIRDVLAILFIAIVFASAVDPWVDRMQRFRIPRGLGIVLILLAGATIVILSIALLVPPIVTEVTQIASTFPSYYQNILETVERFQRTSTNLGIQNSVQDGLSSISDSLSRLTSGLFAGLTGIFGGIFSLLGFLMLTFYLTVEERGMKKFIASVAPPHYQPYLAQKIHEIQRKMGAWFRGQLILSLVIGVVTYVGLLALGVDYALVLALFAGVFEFVPYVGPIISAIPAVFLAFAESPVKALLVLVLYIIIQQLENQVLVPKIMQKAVGLNPVVVIVVMLIGAKLAGLLGMILAVPTATIISIFAADFFQVRREKAERLEIDDETPQP